MLVKPVIFLSYANSNKHHLPELNKEDDGIYETLLEGEEKNFYKIHRDQRTTLYKLFQYLNRFTNRVIIFHFGGHADLETIKLETEDGGFEQATFMGGVVPKLAQQNNLFLVFLNGCFTKEQAQLLIDNGIKSVIATSRPVEDRKAKEFAIEFYTTLSKGKTLDDAYKSAKGLLESKYHSSVDKNKYEFTNLASKENYRGFIIKDLSVNESIPWHWYYKDKEVLEDKLPKITIEENQIILNKKEWNQIDSSNISRLHNEEPNLESIVEAIINEIKFYEKGILDLKDSKPPELHELIAKITTHFPPRIDETLHDLSHCTELGEEYLIALVNTYNALVELLLYSMFSQLWDFVQRFSSINLSLALKQKCCEFFELDNEKKKTFNYISLIKLISEVFVRENIPFFIEEFGALREAYYEEDQTQLFNAIDFIEELKVSLFEKGIPFEKQYDTIRTCEDHMKFIFSNLGFCIQYKLMAINDIQLTKERHFDPKYLINRAYYNNVSYGANPRLRPTSYQNYTEDRSVILIKQVDDLRRYLNLSPFVIDKNYLDSERAPELKKAKISRLFFYSYFDKENDRYVYIDCDDDSIVEHVSVQRNQRIWNLIKRFKKEVFENT